MTSQPKTAVRFKKRTVALLVGMGVYVASYTVLSWRGGYIGHNQGGSDNRATWFPAHCAEAYISPAGRQKIGLTPLGCIFLPAMLVDQLAIHRTRFER